MKKVERTMWVVVAVVVVSSVTYGHFILLRRYVEKIRCGEDILLRRYVAAKKVVGTMWVVVVVVPSVTYGHRGNSSR